MNQSELILKTAQITKLSRKDVESVLKAAGSAIRSTLIEDGKAVIPGIGNLSVNQRKARTGRNPKTGAPVAIPAKKVPHFSAAKALEDALATA